MERLVIGVSQEVMDFFEHAKKLGKDKGQVFREALGIYRFALEKIRDYDFYLIKKGNGEILNQLAAQKKGEILKVTEIAGFVDLDSVLSVARDFDSSHPNQDSPTPAPDRGRIRQFLCSVLEEIGNVFFSLSRRF